MVWYKKFHNASDSRHIHRWQIVPDTPPAWPNGKRVVIEPVTHPVIEMMTENDQGSDPESIARWLSLAEAISPTASSPLDDPAVVAWREKMRQYNVDAVRKQMQEAPGYTSRSLE